MGKTEDAAKDGGTLRARSAAIPGVPGVSEALSRVFSTHDIAHAPTSKLRMNVNGRGIRSREGHTRGHALIAVRRALANRDIFRTTEG